MPSYDISTHDQCIHESETHPLAGISLRITEVRLDGDLVYSTCLDAPRLLKMFTKRAMSTPVEGLDLLVDDIFFEVYHKPKGPPLGG